MRRDCPAEDWAKVASLAAPAAAFGEFHRGRLVAISGYVIWGEAIAHLAVLVHPDYRGRGLAIAAVEYALEGARSADLVPQYRFLESNPASREVGARAGFEWYIRTLVLRAP
jgi:GNAT superfamily N-acetyltransferase